MRKMCDTERDGNTRKKIENTYDSIKIVRTLLATVRDYYMNEMNTLTATSIHIRNTTHNTKACE